MKNIQGAVYIMGDNVNTDDIVPSHCLTLRDASEMAQYTCETIDSDFPQKIKKLNIIVAGENFGCGSSREEAVNVLKILGVKAIIAKSFARIYFRNLINKGIPGIPYHWKEKEFSENDQIQIGLEEGIIRNITKNSKKAFERLPPFLLSILEEGGILNKIKKDL
jgi:3-isopropylmalate/(R)-2-methylmalate dehydratase small subunit